MKPTLVFDADDTLWENEAYYQQCATEFGELMATLGLDPKEAKHTLDDVERVRVRLTGYGPVQFIENMVITYQQLCEQHGLPVTKEIADGVREIGQVVMDFPIVLLDGVEDTLTRFNGHYRLLLLTKGDQKIQEEKVTRSGLAHFFDGVHVVPEKDAQVFRNLVAEYGLEPERTWMIGNSPRSDINPALEAGIGAVHIPHATTWVLERQEIATSERVVILDNFGELVSLFLNGEQEVERMTEYKIRPYMPADNARLAVMWNESDDQWPGTFTQGVPMTEDFVREWMDEEVCLIRFVIDSEADGSIVGFGSLWETVGQTDGCHVEMLNVHPAHQKRSLARRMLTRMVDYAADHDYRRMTIETWPGNLKSVPLYKKVGFFWTPDTTVYMENYIPAIRQLAVAQRFFERHDWYATFRRELEQVEDDQRHPATGDTKVYAFRWEADGEYLEAVVDRLGQSLAGLETADFSAHTIVDESEPAQGITYPVRWKVVNKKDEPVDVSVLAEGQTGIKLNHRSSFTLAAGGKRVVEATFTCAADAPRLDDDKFKAAPQIKTTLVVGGEVVKLGTGLRYRPAVEISAEPEFPSLLPGEPKTVHLQLRNRAGRPLSGTVSVSPQEGLTTDWLSQEFEAEDKDYVGLPLTVTCDQAGTVPLLVSTTFADAGRQITTNPQRIPLLVTPLGGVSADQGTDKIVVENDFFQLTCRTKGGICHVENKARQARDAIIAEEVGPPFEPRELQERQYGLALKRGQGWAKATVTVKSDRFPGLTIAREITVTGSPLMQVRYQVTNDAATPSTFKLSPRLRFVGKDVSHVALPRKERVVIERMAEFPVAKGDMPKKPELLAEQWMAFTRDGQVAGVVWNGDLEKHEFWWERLFLFFSERTLEPQSATNIGPLYVYAGPGDWRDVRRVWQRTVGAVPQQPEIVPEPDRPHAFGVSPAPLVTLNGQIEASLYANSIRKREMQGRIVIELPSGWTVDQAEFPIESLTCKKPLAETLRLTATDKRIGAAGGQLRIEGNQFDEIRPFTMVRLGDERAAVRVEEMQESEQPLWVVDNGHSAWTVAPAYHGGVTTWREADSDVNHLMTAFPESGKRGWLKPWFGGIWPIITPVGDDEDIWPGKLHEETFTAAPLERADARGIPWRGVQVAASIKREGFEGLRAEVAYLTVGGSNILKVVYRLVNETSVYRRYTQGLLTFCQTDGRHQDTILYGEGYQRKSTAQMAFSKVGAWGAAVNPATGRAAVMVGASGKKRMELSDWGVDGGHLMFYNTITLKPHSSHEMVAYLALAESLEEAERYGSIAL
ncbi:MAG: GNAT family N-acetyltransferase [Chloroflexi bacterium]|nr:GNAT family N-acetyltransferase [Chloroflexota bacterium]